MRARRSVLCVGLMMVLLTVTSIQGSGARKTRVFILSGQSNMAGLNPDLSFTPAVKKAFPDDEVIVVKSAQSGQPIRRWYKNWKAPADAKVKPGEMNGDLYGVLMSKVQGAIAVKKIDSVTFVWMQGEADAQRGGSSVYEESLRGLIKQLRDDLKRPDMSFVIGRLSDYKNGTPGWDAVRAAQEKVAKEDPLGAWIDTDDLNGPKNDLHYNREGYLELGRRFAAKAVDLLGKQPGAGTPSESAQAANFATGSVADPVTSLGERGPLLLEEDFDAAALPAAWSIKSGEVRASQGTLHARQQKDQRLCLFSCTQPFQDAVIQVDFRFDGAGGLNVGVNPAPGETNRRGHLFSVMITHAMWNITDHHDRRDPTGRQVLASAAERFEPGRWYTLRIETKGPDVVATVSGKPSLRASSKAFDVRKPGIEFRVAGRDSGDVHFDNLRIWELK